MSGRKIFFSALLLFHTWSIVQLPTVMQSETNANESWVIGDPSTRPSGCLLSSAKIASSACIVHTALTGVDDEKEPAATKRSHFEVLRRESTMDPKVVGGIHPLPTSKHPLSSSIFKRLPTPARAPVLTCSLGPQWLCLQLQPGVSRL